MTSTDERERTVVYLGNRQAIELVGEPGARERRPIVGAPRKNCTTISIPAEVSLMDAGRAITDTAGVWASHSDADAPAWVASTNPALAALLGDHWDCEVRGPEPDHEASGTDDLVEG